jgi:hypothetical protein
MANTLAKPKLFFENVNIKLKNIEYKDLDPSIENVKVVFNDEFEFITCTKQEVVLHVQRTVTTDPIHLFELKIKIELRMALNQKEHKFDGNQNELKDYANEHITTIIDNSRCMQTISLLVSQISSAYGRIPIVTPPNFITRN